MGLGKWLKSTMGAIVFATGSVGKAALSQGEGAGLGNGAKQHRRHRQGSLADDLKQGQVTQQVQELRWRMYKVLEESQKFKTKVVGYDEDGFMLTETVINSDAPTSKNTLSKIKVDDNDNYDLELVVNNDEVTLSVHDALSGVEGIGDILNSVDENGDQATTIGEINGELYESMNKPERVIACTREFRSKFEIEKFAKKMNVRTISEDEKLLEFYVSIYPDEYNRKSRFFISEIKKAIKNPRMCDFLDLKTVEFVSYNTIGVKDLYEFEYEIVKFDKIIEFGGYYVIKFKAKTIKNGVSLYDKFKEGAEELIEKYKNKAPKE